LLHPAPAEVVTKFNAAWEAGDIEAALSFIADDAVYELHVSNEVLPFGGEAVGHAAIETALRRIRADWDYILYRPMALAGAGDIVRFQVEFMYRHRASGQVLNGRFRLVMRIENGLIKRADEYHDRAKVEAFMRLVGGSEPP
jgi:ketosteroid isomerase-like protein